MELLNTFSFIGEDGSVVTILWEDETYLIYFDLCGFDYPGADHSNCTAIVYNS